MSFIYKNEDGILENKKYYNNIISKIKSFDPILLICSDITFTNIYEDNPEKGIINLRFYKPTRFMNNNISLEIVYKYLIEILPNDLALKTFKFYLNDNISFKYIKEKHINPIKITIKYCNKLDKYKLFIDKKENILLAKYSYKNYIVRDILVLKIIENYEKILNKKEKTDIKKFFKLDDKIIELNNLFTIKMGINAGWGLKWI